MKEEKTKSKKSIIYSVIVGICALMLIAATVLTVYFATRSTDPVVNLPPVDDTQDPPVDDTQDPPVDDTQDPPDDSGKDEPSGGDNVATFCKPIEYEEYSVVYDTIYNNRTLGWWYRHKAIDCAAAAGTSVVSMAKGTVETVSVSKELGNLVVIDHGNGLKSYYRFIEPTDTLKEGASVEMGQKIGTVAESYGSEAADGTHLHLEMELKGDFVDPVDYLEPVLEEK